MSEQDTVKDDELERLSPAELARMVRDKRKSEATYRTRLRDVEAELERVRETVTGWQGSELAKLAAAAGVADTALSDVPTHVPLEMVVGDDGLLDTGKVETALETLKAERPHMFQQPQVPATTGAPNFDGAGESKAATSWADVI